MAAMMVTAVDMLAAEQLASKSEGVTNPSCRSDTVRSAERPPGVDGNYRRLWLHDAMQQVEQVEDHCYVIVARTILGADDRPERNACAVRVDIEHTVWS